MRRIYMAAALLAAALLLWAGLGGGKEPAPAPPADWVQPDSGESPAVATVDKPTPIAEQMKGQTGIVQMTITDSGFEPAVLTTNVGGRVKIHLRNASAKEHNLVIERFGIATSVMPPGSENYVEFTAGQKGEWEVVSDALGAPEPEFQGVLKVE